MTTRFTLGVLVVGALFTVGAMIYAGDPAEVAWWLLFVPFAAWGVAPFVILGRSARAYAAVPWAGIAMAVAASSISAIAVAALYATFATDPDPQSGLVFLFLPIWQMIVAGPFIVLARFLAERHEAD